MENALCRGTDTASILATGVTSLKHADIKSLLGRRLDALRSRSLSAKQNVLVSVANVIAESRVFSMLEAIPEGSYSNGCRKETK